MLFSTQGYSQDIFKVLKVRDYQKLEQLLMKGESSVQYNENGLTPLWMAVAENDTASVNLLLRYGADINLSCKNGMPPIMVGCIANAVESVAILLDHGADVNWRSPASSNQQPIRFASQGGSLRLVKLLLDHGADMESTPDDKATPLLAAIHAKKYDIATFYFNSGANVNVLGRDGECVIHEAIKTGNPDMVKLSLEHNAPLNYVDPKGKTTWQLAKQSGSPEIKALVKEALK
ncbi:hypothetical protein GCM10009122_04570 [Fulvivirga kasyanovii]